MGKYHGDDQIEFKDSRFHELKTAKHELVLNSIRSRSVYLISDFWGRNSKWTEILHLYKILEKTLAGLRLNWDEVTQTICLNF